MAGGHPGEPPPCLGDPSLGGGVEAKAGPETQSEELGERSGDIGVCRGPGRLAWLGSRLGLVWPSLERDTGCERWGRRRLAGHPDQQWAPAALALVCLTGLNFCFWIISVGYNLLTRQSPHFRWTVQLSSAYSQSCASISSCCRTLPHPKRKPVPLSCHLPLLPQPPAATRALSLYRYACCGRFTYMESYSVVL